MRGIVRFVLVVIAVFTLLFAFTNFYLAPIFITGEVAGTPVEEASALRHQGGIAWPGTTYDVREFDDRKVRLIRRWLGILEIEYTIGPRGAGWTYTSEVVVGAAQQVQTVVLAVLSVGLSLILARVRSKSRRSSGALDRQTKRSLPLD